MRGDDLKEMLGRARAALELGRPEEGVAFAMRAVALAPGDAGVLCALARLQGASGQLGEQLRTAERAVAADPESEWAHRLRGQALWRIGRFQAAAEALAEAVRLEPTEPRALWGFAWYASMVGRAEEALEVARRSITLYPDDPKCWFGLGWAAWAVKDWTLAEDALGRARALEPDNSLWHNNLGILYAKRQRISEALPCFERALELDPRSDYAYQNAAYCLRCLGRWDEAAELVERDLLSKLHAAEKTIERMPSASARTSRALALKGLQRHEEAEDELERALQLARSPDERARPLRLLAVTNLLLGQEDSARQLAAQAIYEFPADLMALSAASWIGWLTRDAVLAERAADAAVEHKLAPVTVAECKAGAALARADWERAEEQLLQQLEFSRSVGNCCTHAALGTVHDARGEPERVAHALLEAKRANPQCETLAFFAVVSRTRKSK